MERHSKLSRSTDLMSTVLHRRKVMRKYRRALMTNKRESAGSASAKTKTRLLCPAVISVFAATAARVSSKLGILVQSADSTSAHLSPSSTSEANWRKNGSQRESATTTSNHIS